MSLYEWGVKWAVRLAQAFLGLAVILLGSSVMGIGGILGWTGSAGAIVACVFIPGGLLVVAYGLGLVAPSL